MMKWRRGWVFGPALLLAACCAGCDLGTLAYFLSPESKVTPDVKSLASADKKKEVKVVILAYAPGLDLDLMQSDRQLAELLAKRLRDQYERNQEKVTLIPPHKVEEFKNRNPDLRERDIGKHFKADYVIVLDIHKLGIYDKGSSMYRGNIDMTVTLIDLNNAEEPPDRREYNAVYPNEAKWVEDISPEMPPLRFRLKFLDNVAKKVTRYFAAYSTREAYDVD
jgi:hypothetical protein